MLFRKHIFVFFLVASLFMSSCVEPFDTDTEVSITDALVVDARLTDQNMEQSILLSRTFAFDVENPQPETQAEVVIKDDLGAIVIFNEVSSGIYKSNGPLQPVAERQYQLQIKTQDNTIYTSDFESFPENIPIGELDAKCVTNNSGIDGVAIQVSNSNTSLTPNYFRYEYDETYKLIAPDFNPFDWDEVDYDFFCEDDDGWEVTIAVRDEEARICYATNVSKDVILTSTENLNGNSLESFEVRFLGNDNPFIAHRYSILVKQYHHNANAASFYNTLNDFSSEESVFSNTQTGLLEGNLSAQNGNALVIGYFELSSYSEKRLFFNYDDLFPGEPLPPYLTNCFIVGKPSLYPEGFHATEINGKIVLDGNDSSPLIEGILSGALGFHSENENYRQVNESGDPDRAPFLVKARGCVDCRVFGENVMPEYWIE